MSAPQGQGRKTALITGASSGLGLELAQLFATDKHDVVLVARKSGRILNLGSTAGFQPGPLMATYYASKAFVNSFTEALAYELRGTGVTATVSCPGATETEFGDISGNARSRLFRIGTQKAPEVARHAYRAMMAGKPMVIPGVRNKLGVQLVRLSSRGMVRAFTARLNRLPGEPTT